MTKTDKIDLIVQLFLAQWVLGTLETPFPAFGKISGVPETSPIFWQMSNNYNFSLFMLGDKGVSILNIEY